MIYEILKFKKLISFIFLFFVFNICLAQEFWGNYLIKKDDGLLSVLVNMDLDYDRPNYKNLLIIGTQTRKCFNNGFPKMEGLEDLIRFSDATELVLDSITKFKLAGIITYKCVGFDVFYIKDTVNVRERMQKLFDRNFKTSKNHFYVMEDKKWEYYYSNLYPKYFDDDFFINQQYLLELAEEGDDLTQEREVNHWVYFKDVEKREKFIENIENIEFKIHSKNFISERKFPYELQFSRKDMILPENITNLTLMIKTLAAAFQGEYNGWGTEVRVHD